MRRPCRFRRPSFESLEGRQMMAIGFAFDSGNTFNIWGDEEGDYLNISTEAGRIRFETTTGPVFFIGLDQARDIVVDLGGGNDSVYVSALFNTGTPLHIFEDSQGIIQVGGIVNAGPIRIRGGRVAISPDWGTSAVSVESAELVMGTSLIPGSRLDLANINTDVLLTNKGGSLNYHSGVFTGSIQNLEGGLVIGSATINGSIYNSGDMTAVSAYAGVINGELTNRGTMHLQPMTVNGPFTNYGSCDLTGTRITGPLTNHGQLSSYGAEIVGQLTLPVDSQLQLFRESLWVSQTFENRGRILFTPDSTDSFAEPAIKMQGETYFTNYGTVEYADTLGRVALIAGNVENYGEIKLSSGPSLIVDTNGGSYNTADGRYSIAPGSVLDIRSSELAIDLNAISIAELQAARLVANAQRLRIDGTEGNDTLVMAADTHVQNFMTLNGHVTGLPVNRESITVYGWGGDDVLDFSGIVRIPTPVQLFGGEGDDTLYGGAGEDYLEGGPGEDTYRGDDAFVEDSVAGIVDDEIAIGDADKITVRIEDGGSAADATFLRSEGFGPDEIGVENGVVSYGDWPIGTVTGGQGGMPLVVDLYDEADEEEVEAIVRNLEFRVAGNAPTLNERTVTVNIRDEFGLERISIAMAVTGVNDAPVLASSPAINLGTIVEDVSNPAGTLVSSFAHSNITDPDAGALKGIAVSSANNIAGTWQYTLDGTNWLNFGAVSRGAVRLLPADATARVRLLPKANYNGTASLWFFAWDQTSGTPGGTADLTPAGTTGGTTAFSTVARQALLSVTPVNDAPKLNTGVAVNLDPIAEESTPAGTLVSSLLGGITDVDTGALKGIAVSSANNIAGTWQYTLDGTNWLNFGAVSRGAVRLLPANATTRVRLLPNANFNGTASIWFFAWDQSSGSPGGTANLTPAGTTGGTTPFSTNARQALLNVTPVNDAPMLNGISGTIGYTLGNAAVILASAATVSDVDSANFAGGQLRVRIATGGGSTNTLAIGSGFTVDASNVVRQGTTIIGTRVSNGIGTNELKINFHANATKGIVQQLVRSITYRNVGGSAGPRKIEFTVSDGDGGLSAVRTKTVNVA